jgi:hypothetical protein
LYNPDLQGTPYHVPGEPDEYVNQMANYISSEYAKEDGALIELYQAFEDDARPARPVRLFEGGLRARDSDDEDETRDEGEGGVDDFLASMGVDTSQTY